MKSKFAKAIGHAARFKAFKTETGDRDISNQTGEAGDSE
jgi:hypothetical protein